MTVHEMMALKPLAMMSMAAAGITTALGETHASVPLQWTGLIALVTAAVGYGTLKGRLEEREKALRESLAVRDSAEDKRYRRLLNSQQYVEAAVTLLAEDKGIHLSDLQSRFRHVED